MEEENVFDEMSDQDTLSIEAPQSGTSEKYLLFLSDGLLFGVSAEHVVEIITNHVITTVPLVPNYIRGIINLRGQIIPIVDIRLLLGQPQREDTCIMILQLQDASLGILVDSVQRMIDLQENTITSIPTQNAQKLVSGMCSLPDGQTMLVFDCDQLSSPT